MKKLFVCETPVQIIIALCLKNQIFNSNDEIDIMLTNTFNEYDRIADRIKQLNIFNNVYIAKIIYKGKLNKLLKFKYVFNIKSFLKKIMNGQVKIYDELYFWNYDSLMASINAYFHQLNNSIKLFIFEEGYISYFPYKEVVETTNSSLMKFVDKMNKQLYGLKRDNVDGIYLFEPDLLLYKPNFPIFKIDRTILETKEFRDNIKFIFDAEKAAAKYDRKYIILEEYHTEYDDEKIFNEIINKVGKDNVIVKLHPRRPEDRFSKKGVKTFGNDGVPWEALLFAKDFSKKVLISIGSGSITTHRMLFGDNMNAYLLFKFLGSNLKQFDEKYMSFWNKLESKVDGKGIHIPNSIEEFYKMLDKEMENDKI